MLRERGESAHEAVTREVLQVFTSNEPAMALSATGWSLGATNILVGSGAVVVHMRAVADTSAHRENKGPGEEVGGVGGWGRTTVTKPFEDQIGGVRKTDLVWICHSVIYIKIIKPWLYRHGSKQGNISRREPSQTEIYDPSRFGAASWRIQRCVHNYPSHD